MTDPENDLWLDDTQQRRVQFLSEGFGHDPDSEEYRWFLAAQQGQTEILREMLGNGIGINVRDGWTKTALIHSVFSGHLDAVMFLIDQGANVNLGNGRGWTPMTWASAFHQELVPRLEAAGGRVGLLEAVYLGEIGRVRSILRDEDDREPLDDFFVTFSNSLILAAGRGRDDLVALMVDRVQLRSAFDSLSESMACNKGIPYGRSDLNTLNSLLRMEEKGQPSRWPEDAALMAAALGGHRRLAETLIANGATRSVFDAIALGDEACVLGFLDKGLHPQSCWYHEDYFTQLAMSRGYPRIAHHLMEAGWNSDGLPAEGQSWSYLKGWFEAAIAGDLATIQTLADNGANLNAIDARSRTALMHTIANGRHEAFQTLLRLGADPNRCWRDCLSAVSCAVLFHRDYLDEVLSAGGRITLREAVALGDLGAVRRLCEAGANFDTNAHWDFDDTFLMVACRRGHLEVAQFLIDQGASMEQTDDLGQTPLIRAVDAEHPEIVALLIARGANVNQRDWFGNSPLEYATVHHRRRIIGYLLEGGAKPSLLDAIALDDVGLVAQRLAEGEDPNRGSACLAGEMLAFATARNHPEIVRLLVEARARL